MKRIVGIDPAINSPGVGVVEDNVLVAAWQVKVPASYKRLPMGKRIRAVAVCIVYDLEQRGYSLRGPEDTLVYEQPKVYSGHQAGGDPKDLIVIAQVSSAVTYALNPTHVLTPEPGEWTGGTQKNKKGPAFNCSRANRMKALLTPAEWALIPEQHDALDGAGLALHATPKALALPRRVYPGASPRRSPG